MLLKQGAAHCVEKCTDAWYSDEEPLFNYMFKEEQFNPTETVSGQMGHFWGVFRANVAFLVGFPGKWGISEGVFKAYGRNMFFKLDFIRSI